MFREVDILTMRELRLAPQNVVSNERVSSSWTNTVSTAASRQALKDSRIRIAAKGDKAGVKGNTRLEDTMPILGRTVYRSYT